MRRLMRAAMIINRRIVLKVIPLTRGYASYTTLGTLVDHPFTSTGKELSLVLQGVCKSTKA